MTLALGIGASTAIFSVVDAAMLRPLPYPKPEQLVSVNPEQVLPDGKVSRATASMEDMRFMQKADDVFSQVAAWGSAFRGRIAEGPEPERIQVAHYTEDYLPMHGVTPQVGRSFTLADMQPDAPLVALLGHGYWQSRFGGGDVLGQTIRLEEDIAEIVGVLPPWFNASTPVSIPHRVPPAEFGRRGTGRVSIYARLRDGVTIEQATERMSARMATWTPSGGGRPPAGVGRASISSRLDAATSAAQTTVNILLGAVGLILLIACVNVAGLLLARGANRQGELAVRASIGASRWRLIRQVLTESVVLVIPGAALGVLPRLADARRHRRQHPAVAAVELAGHAEPHRPRRHGGACSCRPCCCSVWRRRSSCRACSWVRCSRAAGGSADRRCHAAAASC